MELSFLKFFQRFFSNLSVSSRECATALTVLEMEELENIFALIVLGSFVGYPSPPSFLAVELLPFMERDLRILNQRAKDANDKFAEMCGMIGID